MEVKNAFKQSNSVKREVITNSEVNQDIVQNKKVAIYIRVENIQQNIISSVEVQKERLTTWCQTKGFNNYEYYIDVGLSKNDINRPGLTRLINDIKQETISHCVMYSLDCLSRYSKDMLYLIENIFDLYNITLISLEEGMDTSIAYGKLLLAVKLAFLKQEIETYQTLLNVVEKNKHMHSQKGGSNG